MESSWTLEATEVTEATGAMETDMENGWIEMVRNQYKNTVQRTYEK